MKYKTRKIDKSLLRSKYTIEFNNAQNLLLVYKRTIKEHYIVTTNIM